jgi:hypothetical protein
MFYMVKNKIKDKNLLPCAVDFNLKVSQVGAPCRAHKDKRDEA